MGMIQRREQEAIGAAALPPPSTPTPGPKPVDKKLSAVPVLDLKSRQIQAQGCWQAAASNPGLIGYAADIEAFKEVVRTLAEDGLKFIQEKTQ